MAAGRRAAPRNGPSVERRFYLVWDVGPYLRNDPRASLRKGTTKCTIQYLESLLRATTGQVLLVWDQAKWHTSKKVRKWLNKHDRIETHLLPAWSPDTNPMEDLWRELKEQVAACLERSLDTLLESAKQYLANLSGKQALRTAGLYVN
ncbi:transposase [Salinibacter ruber]|uniref:transposase n=1 Tax=Salinibacter ruber TaxID=146919 RepID=UPI000C9FF6B5|nr:transposase [Salinibacter ruber]